MSDSPELKGTLDDFAKIISLCSLALSMFAAWVAFPLDSEMKVLQNESQQLSTKLRQSEYENRVAFDLYNELKQIIGNPNRTTHEEEAARVLIESLAEDPLRGNLLGVLAVAAKDKTVKDSARDSSRFYLEEPYRYLVETETYNVDIFYCAQKGDSSKSLAESLLSRRPSSATGLWRVRFLPESVNRRPGYQISNNEIRFNPPAESKLAAEIQSVLKYDGIVVDLHPATTATPGYLSVFFCK